MDQHGESHAPESVVHLPSGFKYVIAASALFIAGCSAFFSVCGLGFLFVGSSVAVMIMASSLEAGKLVAASFLYRYWYYLNRPIKIYLTTAVLILIGITSLGNYGFLARAYERTHTRITAFDDQIAALEKEIADTQLQIDASRSRIGRNTDASRDDIARLQQRITEADTQLEQSLTRLQERRKIAQERHNRDIQLPVQQLAEKAEVLKKAIASEESAITDLNERLAVLDRAVDAYTKQGGPDLLILKTDSVKKGQELHEKQRPEREAIAAQTADHRKRQEKLRADHMEATAVTDKELSALRDKFANEMSLFDTEEQDLREAHDAAVAQVEQQVTKLQLQGKDAVLGGDTQIESLYQRIRARRDEIQHLHQQISAIDIGPYRFVARAFDAPADSVVKWLTLMLVLVFDPFAVSLFVGFNVVVVHAPSPQPLPMVPRGPPVVAAERSAPAIMRRNRWLVLGTTILLVIFCIGAIYAVVKWGFGKWKHQELGAHAALIPGDSFAVISLHPIELQSSIQSQNLLASLGIVAGVDPAGLLKQLLASGIDPRADVYAFAKFPAKRSESPDGRPAMLCGFVARLTDTKVAEQTLAQLAERLTASLRANSANLPLLSHNRVMVQYGRGRYMDPEGGFFTFGLTERSAVFLVEFEGDPKASDVENEMRLCLAPRETAAADTKAVKQLPMRALSGGGVITAWLDTDRFFKHLPKNPAAQTRYEQLQRYLGFDLVLKVQPAAHNQLIVTADYIYQVDRFKDRQLPTAAQQIALVGPVEPAGIAGRLVDRCADMLDYDSLIERLRITLGGMAQQGVSDVIVEKSFPSERNARFTLTAHCDLQSESPPAIPTNQPSQ
jgi:hypothetical protein